MANKTVIVLGSKSDIAQALKPMLEADGYKVYGWARGESLPMHNWDLIIITMGRVAPVGMWWSLDPAEWMECVDSNLITPFTKLQTLWTLRNKNATVIWFGGSNPQKIMPGYSPYHASKMAVLKLVEQLDHETPDCKFVAFGPGYVKTKIHKATLEAGWPNDRIERGDNGNSMDEIYHVMMSIVASKKEMVGGRNICVSDWGTDISMKDFGKLRRRE